MKIVVHDYAGHPPQVQLSRQLAAQGYEVTHAYFADDPGPKGQLQRLEKDPLCLTFKPVNIDRHYSKTAFIARHYNDVIYGKRVARLIMDLKPAVVLSGNTPTAAQSHIQVACKKIGAKFVYWLQDFYSIAVSKLLKKKSGILGTMVGAYYQKLERHQLAVSDEVIIISEDFRSLAEEWAGASTKVHTIENWGALSDIQIGKKCNQWSTRCNLDGMFSFLYSGTLGMKHNPILLQRLAEELAPDASVIVVAQGSGMTRLEAENSKNPNSMLKLFSLQPAEVLPDVLATGDVLIAIIEPEAATFSVPSKILSYMCAGRPILLASPLDNLAARTVVGANAGIVVPPDDVEKVVFAAKLLYSNSTLRESYGRNGRSYAERSFDILSICKAFEAVFQKAISNAHGESQKKNT